MDQPRVSLGVSRHEPVGWQCWVCLASDEEDPLDWVDPCNCIGTTKWVHLPCLMRWVDEKQQGNSDQGVSCPHCNTPYLIKEPHKGLLILFLDRINRHGYKLSHVMAGCILVGSVYWLAVTYGAVTVIQIMGHSQGFAILEKADPLVLLLALPAVPITLIFSRFISWDETVMHFLRHCATKFSLLGKMFPLFAIEKPAYRIQFPDLEKMQNRVVRTRLVCGGLLLPSVATFFGRLFFKSHTAIQRTLYGGLTYILVKGLINIYYKQDSYYRMCKRTVLRASGGQPINLEPVSSAESSDNAPAPSRTDAQEAN